MKRADYVTKTHLQ